MNIFDKQVTAYIESQCLFSPFFLQNGVKEVIHIWSKCKWKYNSYVVANYWLKHCKKVWICETKIIKSYFKRLIYNIQSKPPKWRTFITSTGWITFVTFQTKLTIFVTHQISFYIEFWQAQTAIFKIKFAFAFNCCMYPPPTINEPWYNLILE